MLSSVISVDLPLPESALNTELHSCLLYIYRSVPLIPPPHFVHYIPPKVGGGLIFEDP